MSGAALSFHLVDRIVELEPERRARGTLAIPVGMSGFPACLVVEAIGQLAAWVAMLRADFESRPVAARTGDVRLHGRALPGSVLDLEVDIQSCKRIAVAYSGRAHRDGELIVELERSAGAMVPMSEFEDPAEARDRFDRLRGPGLPPRSFPSPEHFGPRLESVEIEPGRIARAGLVAAPPGPLYADHFPRRPVYPATLLLDAQIGLAARLIAAADVGSQRPLREAVRVRDIRVRAFTPPGGRVDVIAEVSDAGREPDGDAEVQLTATAGDQRISTATVVIR